MAKMSDIDKLIADNMGLVYKQLHRVNRAYDDEAFSKAMIGLMKAAKTYDSSRNVAFSTYATACIYNEIAMYLRHLNRKKRIDTVSYNAPVCADDGLTFEDLLSTSVDPESELIKQEYIKAVLVEVKNLYNSQTNPSAKLALRVWIKSDFTASQKEIANATGTSQPYVSRILSAFKHKLKMKLEELQW